MDFEITNLPKPGMGVPIVLPLGNGVSLPADAVYRKFNKALGWVTFVAMLIIRSRRHRSILTANAI